MKNSDEESDSLTSDSKDLAGESKEPGDVFVPARLRPPQQGGGAMKLLLAAVFGLLIASGGLALFFVNTVTFSLNPSGAQVVRLGGVSIVQGNTLYGFGASHNVAISAAGYYGKLMNIRFDEETPPTLPVVLEELPGQVVFSLAGDVSSSGSASLYIDDVFVGEIAQEPVALARGNYRYRVEHPRYLPGSGELEVAGLDVAQTESVELEPNWRTVTLTSNPSGASVFHEDAPLGQTPVAVNLIPGLYILTYRKDGFDDEKQLLEFDLGPDLSADTVSLSLNGGTLNISSNPSGARVLIDGVYSGLSPLAHPVNAGRKYAIQLEKDGYDTWSDVSSADSGQKVSIAASLDQQFGGLTMNSTPGAMVHVDGRELGQAPVEARLAAGDHLIEFHLPGYRSISQTVSVKKDDALQIDVTLMTEKGARHAEAKSIYKNAVGMNMVLARPSAFTMGAPRGEAGQMANETQRRVRLERWFYIAESEVSHRHFADFLSEMAGVFPGVRVRTPANADLPVTGIPWEIAALYCNWLSVREGLPEAYQNTDDRLVLDNRSIGYRLPTEAEWEWAARVAARPDMPVLKYPWGNQSTVPPGAGNFADSSVITPLPHRIPNYSDGFSAVAPVKSFDANPMGLHDMGGNVAEWVHDYYGIDPGIPGRELLDPTGPESGLDHVVKGSSWRSGNETELRFSFRTYSEGAADHIGFRIGRWVH